MHINKSNFPRFSKRLKKSLEKHNIDLPLAKVQNIAAQSLGKENFHELMKVYDDHPTGCKQAHTLTNDIYTPVKWQNYDMGPDALQHHHQQLACIFAALIDHNKELARCAIHAMITGIISDPNILAPLSHYLPQIQCYQQRHGYTYTLLAAMLQDARQHYRVPVAYFIHLIKTDPILWRVLQSTGRSCVSQEATMVLTHYRAEKLAGVALKIPL